MEKLFVSNVSPAAEIMDPSLWFIFHGEDILLEVTSATTKVPLFSDIGKLNFEIEKQIYLGMYEGQHCFTTQIKEPKTNFLPANMEFQPIRQSHASLADEDLFAVVTRAKQILHWDKSTQFCGYCGQRTETSTAERAKKCLSCKTLTFPPISPAMLVLIYRGDEILLGRSAYFLPGIYSILAGFVEPGETLEQAVKREAKEEVNINIKNLRYFGSQPWPFPSNLMLGFFAEYDSGELNFDTKELEDAQWFSIKNLPNLPKPISLSRRMIDAFLDNR